MSSACISAKLNHLSRFLEKTAGRDKLLRTIQYFARFLNVSLSSKYGVILSLLLQKDFSSAIAFLKNIQGQLSVSRKLFRILKPVENLHLATKSYVQTIDKKDPKKILLKWLGITRNVSYAIYLTFDSAIWLDKSRVIKPSKATSKKFADNSNRFWLYGLLINLVISSIKLQTTNQSLESTLQAVQIADEKQLANNNFEARIEALKKEQYTHKKQLVWDALDATLPCFGLKYISVDETYVAFAGLITSALGFKKIWDSAA